MAWIDSLFRKMTAEGASDLHLTSGMVPKFRLHGEIVDVAGAEPLDPTRLREVLDEILPAENREQFDTECDTDFAYELPGTARFRANFFQDRAGPGAVFRQIPDEVLTSEQLNLPKVVTDLCYLSKGLVLVTGPTGSGKSTTLAAMIDHINKNRNDHIITIEDPIEFVHKNQSCLINQREVHRHTQSFKRALRAALREDPDIVLVGEMRDLETIEIAIETAETGHLVFGTLHTSTAATTVDRIIDQFPADRQSQIRTMLASSLKGVIAQTLCKKEGGGRVAALEIMIGNAAVAANIREGKTHQIVSAMQMGGKVGMRLLNDSLLELVQAGTINPMEAYIKAIDKQDLEKKFSENGIAFDASRLSDGGAPSAAPAPGPGRAGSGGLGLASSGGARPGAAAPRNDTAELLKKLGVSDGPPSETPGALPNTRPSPPAGDYTDPFEEFKRGQGR